MSLQTSRAGKRCGAFLASSPALLSWRSAFRFWGLRLPVSSRWSSCCAPWKNPVGGSRSRLPWLPSWLWIGYSATYWAWRCREVRGAGEAWSPSAGCSPVSASSSHSIIFFLLSRQPDRDAGGGAAWRGPARGARLAVADHVHHDACRRNSDARLDLLRRHVWRLDDLDPSEHPGRGRVGRDLSRRSPDGEAGARRRGTGDRGDRLVRRRHTRRDCNDVLCADDRGGRHSFRTA